MSRPSGGGAGEGSPPSRSTATESLTWKWAAQEARRVGEVGAAGAFADGGADRRDAQPGLAQQPGRAVQPLRTQVQDVDAPRGAQLDGADALSPQRLDLLLQVDRDLVGEGAERPAIGHEAFSSRRAGRQWDSRSSTCESRMTCWAPGGLPSPASSSWAATSPSWRAGCSMTVSGGVTSDTQVSSPKPTRPMSSGQRTPSWRSAAPTPAVRITLLLKIASGRRRCASRSRVPRRPRSTRNRP